ncbi:hypothetical protein [Dyella sp. GSA-30]|uniref:hypothetical protein n=1 Tax=Dyella sp. GSA-30 TaxID=2994496 RepID=UPI0024927F70|nr:hypothetical protein [Dyella sp. GSA-30]BDU22767.1 hypothetical protein DYGSA30_42240 [Dyella sp. GSA-30]
MGISSSYMERVVALSRKTGLVRVFCFLGLLFVGAGVHAQVIVEDPTSIAKQISQYATQLDQYNQEIQQYEQLLMKVQGLGTNISFMPNTLTVITDPSELIDQNCPGTPGIQGLITSIASSISMSKPIVVSQQQICASIVTLQVDEYNRTVFIVNQLNQYGGTLQKLNDLANSVDTLGKTNGATTQAATYSATVAKSMNDWQAAIAGDEALIKALNQQQAILSHVAMKGSNSILGNVVQVGVLAGALAIK